MSMMKNTTKFTSPDGDSISPSPKAFSFALSAKGIATWREPQPCHRCGGTGVWRGGWQAGVCYGCYGSGEGRPYKAKGYTEEAYERYSKAKAKREAKKEEAERKELERLLDERSEILDELTQLRSALSATLIKHTGTFQDGFIHKVADTLYTNGTQEVPRDLLVNSWIIKSEKTMAALRKMVTKQAERDEEVKNAPALEAGRQKVKGSIKSIKDKETPYGFVWKLVVETEQGNRLYGTLPSSLGEAEVGDVIEFTATVEPSKDDEHFGFYSRPAKASKVA